MRIFLFTLVLVLPLDLSASTTGKEFRIGEYRALSVFGKAGLDPEAEYVSFTGDYGFFKRLPSSDAIDKHIAQEVPLLANFQLRIINLEAMLSWSAGKEQDKEIDAVSMSILKKSAFNVISLANNHAMDFGPKAVGENIRRLREEGFKIIGTRSFPVYVWERSGSKIAIFALTSYTDRSDPEKLILKIDETDLKVIKSQISGAKFRIAFVHIGSFSVYLSPHEQKQVERVLEAGADLVVCTGTHFIKGILYENRKPVFYGIGNHIFSKMSSDTEPVGMHVAAGFKKGKLVQLFVVPFHNEIFNGKTGPLNEIDFAIFQKILRDRSSNDMAKYYEDPTSLTKLTTHINNLNVEKVRNVRLRHILYGFRIMYHHYPATFIGSGLFALVLIVLIASYTVLRQRNGKRAAER
jgi:poly-gamma-glutamate synthesis protein (capsule biosynthesis protein)